MTADTKHREHPEHSQTDDPAKGGTAPAHQNTYPSGDSPKPQGDKLRHAVDAAAERKDRGGKPPAR
jgi:hypothetical protein